MKLKNKIILASALLGLSLPMSAQTTIPIGNQALLAGWDFDNILGGTISTPSRGRYSDVFGNNSSPTALTAAGGIYFNGTFGSDNWGTVSKTTTGDVNRDILTRSGSASPFDLGSQTGTEGAILFNNANVGVTFDTFSINLHTADAENSFENIMISLWGRDVGNTAGGVTISWAYSIDGGVTPVATGLTSTFLGNVFANSTVDFSGIAALDGVSDIYLLGTVIESQASVLLSLDNIGAYGTAFTPAAIPEPSTYAAIAGVLAIGIAIVRRRRAQVQAAVQATA